MYFGNSIRSYNLYTGGYDVGAVLFFYKRYCVSLYIVFLLNNYTRGIFNEVLYSSPCLCVLFTDKLIEKLLNGIRDELYNAWSGARFFFFDKIHTWLEYFWLYGLQVGFLYGNHLLLYDGSSEDITDVF